MFTSCIYKCAGLYCVCASYRYRHGMPFSLYPYLYRWFQVCFFTGKIPILTNIGLKPPTSYQSIYPSINLSINLSVYIIIIYLFIYLSTYLSIHLSIYPSVYPSTHLSIYPSIHPFIRLSMYPSIHPSIIYPSILYHNSTGTHTHMHNIQMFAIFCYYYYCLFLNIYCRCVSSVLVSDFPIEDWPANLM